jgi:hypothetical protein
MTDPGIEAFRRVTPEGELWGHTWTPKPQPTTRWWRAGELAAPPGNTDHYVSMGLTEQPGTERTRAKQADVTALLAGAWADVDVVSARGTRSRAWPPRTTRRSGPSLRR